MNKFLKIPTTQSGNVLVNTSMLSGVIQIPSALVVYLLFSDSSGAASAKVGLFATAGNFQADEQKTRDVVINAIEKLNQSGYTEATIEVVFPETIIQDVQIIL